MLLPLLISSSWAFTLEGYAWPPQVRPVEIHWTGTQPGWTDEEVAAAVTGAAGVWAEASPGEFGFQVVQDPDAQAWFEAGGNAVLFGDPDGELGSAELGDVQGGGGDTTTFVSNGRTYAVALPMKVVFAPEPAWVTDATIEAGDCSDGFSLQALLTHLLGHLAGLGESCPLGEPCTDPDAANASMYPVMGACDAARSTLSPDDVAGIQCVYGGADSDACARETEDTGSGDTGTEDTGSGDTGTDDSGAADTPPVDTADDIKADAPTGCGCTTSGPPSPLWPLLALLTPLLARRRPTPHKS